jgi:hypothetical protein
MRKIVGNHDLEEIISRIKNSLLDDQALEMPLADLRTEFASEGKDLRAMAAGAREKLN